MKTRAEHLPIELWISIFYYLEIHDLFHTFTNLSRYFDHILASNHLSFYVRLKDNDKNDNLLSTTLFGSDAILNRIIYIEGITLSHSAYISQFLYTNANKLIRLRSVNIKIRLCHERLLFIALQRLNSLEYLSIECIMTQTVIESIFALSSLRICKLIYRNVVTTINDFSGKQSNIEALSVKDYYGHHSIINILLRHMPKLKSLEIFGSTSTLNSLGRWLKDNYYHLEKLHTIKIKSSSSDLTIMFFEQLCSLSSVLKRLSIDIGPSRWDENLLQNLIYYSWPIIEQIEKIRICMRGYIYIDPTDDDIRKKFDNYCKILLSKNNDSNRCFKIEWTEEYLAFSTIIEITILKS
jgi:hypothetical protein